MYSEIVCLYADNHSTRIYDVDGNEYRPRMYYGVLAEQLIEDERFLQVSRGVLCNMDHILEMSKRDWRDHGTYYDAQCDKTEAAVA